jgi:hypothetical protein
MLNKLRRKIFVSALLVLITAGFAVYTFTPVLAGTVCSMKMEEEQCCCCPSHDVSISVEEISKNCSCRIKEAAEEPSAQKAIVNTIQTNPAELITPGFTEGLNFKPSDNFISLQENISSYVLKDIYLFNSNFRI